MNVNKSIDEMIARATDEAEPITREWLLTLPGWSEFGLKTGFIHDSGLRWVAAWNNFPDMLFLGNHQLPRVKTRGQLRQLLELIGDE